MCRAYPARQHRSVQLALHVMEELKVVGDPPEHEVGIRADPFERIGPKDEVIALGPPPHNVTVLKFGFALLLGRKSAEGRIDLEERVVQELATRTVGVLAAD